jgi:catechol 2,3-dioxygenase-like lactoylglutathione lyase family enzyme
VPIPPPTFVCADIRVRNLSRAIRFYRTLGLRIEAKGRMRDGTTLAWLRDRGSGQLLELFQLSRRSPLYAPFRSRGRVENALIFSGRNRRTLLPRLRRLGAHVVREFEDGEVHLLFVRDPDGTLLEFLSWTDEALAAHRGPPLSRVVSRNSGPSRARR